MFGEHLLVNLTYANSEYKLYYSITAHDPLTGNTVKVHKGKLALVIGLSWLGVEQAADKGCLFQQH